MTDAVGIGRAVMLEGRWEGLDPTQRALPDPFFQVLTIREGRIVEMQDCAAREKALRHAKRRAA